MGLAKNIFLWRNFLERSCKITDPDSITSRNPTIGRIITELVRNANTVNEAQRPIMPDSPI